MLSADTKRLEQAYAVLNSQYYGGELPTVMITIQSSRGAYGHCTTQKVWESGDEKYYELNLGAEYLNRPIENVLATLQHEMVHIFCLENGIKDTSNNGRYHNMKFKAEAEKRDLLISRGETIGWSVTQPSEKFIKNIHEWGIADSCENCRVGYQIDISGILGILGKGTDGDDAGTGTKGKVKKPSSTRKYICNTCGISVRATKDVNILCMDCNEQMEKVDK